MFYIKKWLKVFTLMFWTTVYHIKEKLETKQYYRKYKGGTWYLLCEIDSGEEYWTQQKPNQWMSIIIKIEHHSTERVN